VRKRNHAYARAVEFVVVSVFMSSDDPFSSGNPLAVFTSAPALSKSQMQAIADTFNLSETTFVTSVEDDSYHSRIFTPEEELGFAGHPTLGTTWVLRRAGALRGDDVVQHTSVGATPVHVDGDMLWFERGGRAEDFLLERDPESSARIARALGLGVDAIGLEAREMGRPGRLEPAYADAGERLLIVPVKDPQALAACAPRAHELAEFGLGVYCVTAAGAGRLRARGFWPLAGIPEDPATGAAAAALGLLLAARLGSITASIDQGIEMRRPCRIWLDARADRARVGGRCGPVLTGRLEGFS
jgi:trans-2,3-dihydro-3-hydroxyanthranilate isomerase